MISTTEIIDNFNEEAVGIHNYIDYIEMIFHSGCTFCRGVLNETHYTEVKSILGTLKWDCENEEDESKNQIIVNRVLEIITYAINEYKTFIETTPLKEIPQELTNSIIVTEYPELIDYLFDEAGKNIDDYTPKELKTEIDATPESEYYYGMLTVDDYAALLEYAKLKFYNDEIEDSIENYNYLIDKETLFSTMKFECKTNVYRQAFILLLALFDATVTDYFTQLLNADFFGLASKVDLDKSYKLKEVSHLSSMDELKDIFINDIVGSKKVHSLIKTLYEYNKNMFLIDGTDVINDLFEIIGRRNIHIHKKGIVDQTYLSQTNGNPYHLHLGDYAYINSQYFKKCYDMLFNLIQNFSCE